MHMRLSLLTLLLLSGCASVTTTGQIYEGEYFYNFESASFTPKGGSEPWCVAAQKLKDAELPDNGSPGGPWGTAHVVVRGVLSPRGGYCNMSAYKHFLEITEVIEISNRKRRTP